MIFNLQDEHQVPAFTACVDKLLARKAVVEVREKHPNRSLAQNSYLHLIIAFFASEYGCSAEEAKVDFYKRTCNSDIFMRTRTNKRGQKVRYLRSSAQLSTTEMTLSIERFRNWSASVAGFYLPAPAEHQALVYAQRQVENNKEYL